MPFEFKRLEIPDLVLIEAKVFRDERGFLAETYKKEEFSAWGIKANFVQDNLVRSLKKGVLRGLHYQINPMAQAKLLMVIRGEIFDVVVDIRKGSPYYGRWIGIYLSGDELEGRKLLYLPAGFAHGYCVLSEEADVVYKCTNAYSPECERGIAWNDPALAIDWPVQNPILSEKDSKLPTLKEAENNFVYSG